MDTIIQNIFNILESTAFIWAPVLLVMTAFRLWMWYINEEFLDGLKWTVLEIRIPAEVMKSPAAMELVFINALYQTGGYGDWKAKYWDGNLPLWFSLEIVSIEGSVYFFIRAPQKFKTIVESAIFAQYPQAEIREVDDYTASVPDFKKDGEIEVWGSEYKLDKADAWPIKTYVDYGLDKAIGKLKEEERIDPITPLIEFMGTLQRGEQAWFQIIVRPSNWARYEWEEDDKDNPGKKVKVVKKWQDHVKKEIADFKNKFEGKDGKPGKQMTELEKEQLKAMERSLTKYGFDAGIRAVYVANKDAFDKNKGGNFGSSLRQFNSVELNSLKGMNGTNVDFPWQDLFGKVVAKKKKRILSGYKARAWFYPRFDYSKFFKLSQWINKPDQKEMMVLNTEELATLYHFPGRVSETPTFSRISSKKSEAPTNLPI